MSEYKPIEILRPGAWKEQEPAMGAFIEPVDPEPNLLGLPTEGAARAEIDARKLRAAGPALTAMLGEVARALAAHRDAHEHPRFPLDKLDADALALLGEILGEGEVTMSLGIDPRFDVRESVLPGLWRVQAVQSDGRVVQDWIEVGDVPDVVRAGARAMTQPVLELPTAAPEGTMNALPVLAEVAARMPAAAAGEPNHVINFSLLPLTPVDSALITRVLGRAAFAAESRGFGKARVYLTGHRHVWGVQFYNGIGSVILDTLEIGALPVSLLAAEDDYADSAQRLTEILEAYQP